MLKRLFDGIMERRAAQLMEDVRAWMPSQGPVLDLGSGTGHLVARLERELRLEVVPVDVSDMHVTGRAPVLITDGALPFDDDTFAAALLIFMLHYPENPVALLHEVARVTRGPIIVMQSLHGSRFGHAWLRAREFMWSWVAFHLSKLIGYVPAGAEFTMNARRFHTAASLERDLSAARLRISAQRERPVLRGGALVVGTWLLERDV